MLCRGARKADKKHIHEVVGRDVAGHLSIQILETENKLGDDFVGSLFDGIELAK